MSLISQRGCIMIKRTLD